MGEVQRASLLPGVAGVLLVGLYTPHVRHDQRRRPLERRGNVGRPSENATNTGQARPRTLVALGVEQRVQRFALERIAWMDRRASLQTHLCYLIEPQINDWPQP